MADEWKDEEAKLLEHLDSLDEEKRVDRIDELIHFLNYQRRYLLLTDEERAHACDESLSPAMRDKLDKAKTEAEREKLIQMYARGNFFRKCAWADYLNGVTEEKPFDSKLSAGAAK